MSYNILNTMERCILMKLMTLPATAKPDRTKYKNAICVSIDNINSCFEFSSIENGDVGSLRLTKKEYKSKPYNADFLAELTSAVSDFAAGTPFAQDSYVTVLVPDTMVALETVTIPNMNKRRNDEAIAATISGLYKNKNDLLLNQYIAMQNKQVVTFSYAAANKKTLTSITEAITEGGLNPACVTFKSNAVTNAAFQISPRTKATSFVLLDIKENSAGFSFVAKGRTVGFYNLPFGYSILQKNKLASEDMLFDHSVAELAVLNAREKAKAKQLTVMTTDETQEGTEPDENLDALFGEDENSTTDPTNSKNAGAIKTLPKKEARKLPKFMLRPQPRNDEEYGYENFRIFVKWALTLLQANQKLTSQGKPECVYVNLPNEMEYLFDMVNSEREENEIEFFPLEIRGSLEKARDSLELLGALYASQYNRNNNFLF